MLFKLMRNENMKIYGRLRTWILVGIILVATVLVGIVVHSNTHPSDPNWKQSLISEDAKTQQTLNKESEHMPAAAIQQMKQQLQVNEYYISHNVDPHQTSAWDFSVTAQNLIALAMAFIVVIAGDIVASEFSTGTIKMLLTQTATRSKILLSKYMSALVFALFMVAALLVFSVVIGGIFFGFSGADAPKIYADANSQIQQMSMISYLFMQYGFAFIDVVVTTTIAFMISAIFRSSALAITISILAYLIGNTLVGALSSFSWVKYILFANTDLSQYVVGGARIQGMTLGFSITTVLVYFVVMLVLSWFIFKKRDVAYT